MGQGVPADVAELDREYGPFIDHTLRRVSRGQIRSQDLEDLHQEVLLRVLRQGCLERFDPGRGATFATYLFRIVHSTAINRFASNSRNPLNATDAGASDVLLTAHRGGRAYVTAGSARGSSIAGRQVAMVLDQLSERRVEQSYQTRLALDRLETRLRATRAAEGATETLYQVYDLRYRQGLSVAAVATRLNKSKRWVLSAGEKIRAQTRACLGEPRGEAHVAA